MASSRFIVIHPEEPWPVSNVTEGVLRGLVAEGLLCPHGDAADPAWLAPAPDHHEPHPPEGYVVSFVAFHKRGFGAEPNRFMKALPIYYECELHNLTPNSIAHAAAFVTICEGYLRIPVH